MTSSLLTPASAMTALKNLTAAAQGGKGAAPAGSSAASGGASARRAPGEASPAGPATGQPANAESYVTSLSEAIASGLGSLVNADMNVAAARLRALQAQKLLGAQGVSIANQHSQLVLKLFGG